jgi:hypothetical protein
MEIFQHNNEVVLDIFNIQTACTILPALQEGHVIGTLFFFLLLYLLKL